ncbi:hypothetical protein Kpol_478p5 [Vanderwaltozyma polyspora DSM 70294]|uniref:RRM domain-containing protein n=1 Tax=Vanderwaltozyma polyspora (strain ATCC 22028 / DSM 70294 / BCRC 21397 / CBS 2163 / NBRC 10782 / NRRL Y-8283 / UCD 57-17) TaxID=436907 RepID=A7TPM5_VANPO|nr:uncharacterized protein Kpol_478p5 [Vanderwaltozyma polyspora DSM 70294]EDO15770.1 hypothetical protein Kpol_478p5 [Vanderwaltozyma polyspora DSM 70294]
MTVVQDNTINNNNNMHLEVKNNSTTKSLSTSQINENSDTNDASTINSDASNDKSIDDSKDNDNKGNDHDNKENLEETNIEEGNTTVDTNINITNSTVSFRGRPSSCVFVASLAASLSDDELCVSVTENFKQYGNLARVKVLRDPANRPYAFVQYTNDKDAKKALKKAQGSILNGRILRCEPAKVNRTLFVTHSLPISYVDVAKMCEKFGELELLVPNRENNQYVKRYCYPIASGNSWFVQFAYRDDAIRAFANLRTDANWDVEWVQNIKVSKRYNLLLQIKKENQSEIDNNSIFKNSDDLNKDIDSSSKKDIKRLSNTYPVQNQHNLNYNSNSESEQITDADSDTTNENNVIETQSIEKSGNNIAENEDQQDHEENDNEDDEDEDEDDDDDDDDDEEDDEDEEHQDHLEDDEEESDDDSIITIDKKSIFVGQLDPATTKETLRERFSAHGEIVDINLIVKPTNVFAFIQYETEEAAAAALERENHAIFLNKTMHVQYKEIGGLHGRRNYRRSSNYFNDSNSKQYTGPQFNLAPPPINMFRRRSPIENDPMLTYLPPPPIPGLSEFEINPYLPYIKNSYSYNRKSLPTGWSSTRNYTYKSENDINPTNTTTTTTTDVTSEISESAGQSGSNTTYNHSSAGSLSNNNININNGGNNNSNSNPNTNVINNNLSNNNGNNSKGSNSSNRKKYYKRNNVNYNEPLKPYYFQPYYYHPMHYPLGPMNPGIPPQASAGNHPYMMLYPIPPPPPTGSMMSPPIPMGQMGTNIHSAPSLPENQYGQNESEGFVPENKSYHLDY